MSETPLSLDAHVEAVATPADGAVATFVGRVRNHDPSVTGEVTALDYSAHPDAATVIDTITRQLTTDTVRVVVTHRLGLLHVGDVAIIAAAAAPHRAEAFEACRDVVERVKAEAPIWKREFLADGSHTWVGLT
ncbi:molybdenum cofactor biosynthesis protein MoaE [Demequina globuliformis]|uniref:molybdenum cofactor biosynthesis protein MoaE n=1 Tax=Demequina globuliformis TaxID=676202 RepID=UPI001F34851D|nr:molybdenum cofactor biosynthesis protein MoaE [Demequina globuliformis]